ncbi:hypothetical protein ACCT09_27245, partial [Rhizobium ruizarguesonis]
SYRKKTPILSKPARLRGILCGFGGGTGGKTLSPIKITSETEKVRYFRNCEYTSRGDEKIGKCLNCVLLFGISGGCFLGVF